MMLSLGRFSSLKMTVSSTCVELMLTCLRDNQDFVMNTLAAAAAAAATSDDLNC